jgi:peptide/nickel transport system permease protein
VRFAATKTAFAVGTLVFVLVFNFFLFRIAGNPIDDLIRGNPHLSEQGRERLIHDEGLDQSDWTQFRIYVSNTLHGDLGTSFQTNQPVSTMIWQALPNTLILVGIATLLATIIGTWLGIHAAAKRGSPTDTGITQTSLFFYAMPDFWAGMILIWFFAVELHLFPTSQKSEPGGHFSTVGYMWNVTQHATLPIITLTIGILGSYVVIMRSALADTLREDFVTTAQAVGMPRHRVLQRATRNAILPVVALSAISFGFVISGAVVVETLFSWPGMGLLSYRAILNKDYPVMEGVFLVASAAVIIANLIADLLYAYLDPRVRNS